MIHDAFLKNNLVKNYKYIVKYIIYSVNFDGLIVLLNVNVSKASNFYCLLNSLISFIFVNVWLSSI